MRGDHSIVPAVVLDDLAAARLESRQVRARRDHEGRYRVLDAIVLGRDIQAARHEGRSELRIDKVADEYAIAAGVRECRNPVGLGVNPRTGELWCSTNERDALGDNLVPDYVTHVQKGGFYGWPWYYLGGHQDPRHAGKHPELKDKVLVPDVLVSPHNASLGLTFYDGNQFPAEYTGDLFAAEHGSWNRANRTGYEVIRVPLKDGHASGEFEDFLTGFVTADGQAWGRPVGVAVSRDGSLLVTDDGSQSIWRVSYVGK